MGLRLAVAGATGLVGSKLLEIIGASGEEIDAVGPLASASSAGSTVRCGGRELTVLDLAKCDFREYDAALFCIGDELSAQYVPRALEAGCSVVDKSNAFRLSPGVPLVVAGVNDAIIGPSTPLVANPNCSTIILAHSVAPLEREYGLRRIWAATYQSVSGAGSTVVNRFAREVDAAPSACDIVSGAPADDTGYAYNVIPAIGGRDEQGRCGEEAKLCEETRKILGRPDLAIVVHAARVPVVVGHSIAVTVELDRHADVQAIAALWRRTADVEYLPNEPPSPLRSQRHDKVEVGRLRRELSLDNGVSFFVSGDNLNLGAALNGWRILERMIAAGALRAHPVVR